MKVFIGGGKINMRVEQDFGGDLKFGHKGEDIVHKIFALKGKWMVRQLGKMDYDLLSDSGKRIDVKYDRYSHTGNVCLEVWSNKHYKTKGWIQKDIDYLAYIFADRGGVPKEIVLYDMKLIQHILLTCWSKDGTWETLYGFQTTSAVHNGNENVENILVPKVWLNMTNPKTLYRHMNTESKGR